MNKDFWNMLESDSLSIPCSIESEILESGIFPEKSNDSLIFNFENDQQRGKWNEKLSSDDQNSLQNHLYEEELSGNYNQEKMVVVYDCFLQKLGRDRDNFFQTQLQKYNELKSSLNLKQLKDLKTKVRKRVNEMVKGIFENHRKDKNICSQKLKKSYSNIDIFIALHQINKDQESLLKQIMKEIRKKYRKIYLKNEKNSEYCYEVLKQLQLWEICIVYALTTKMFIESYNYLCLGHKSKTEKYNNQINKWWKEGLEKWHKQIHSKESS